MSPNDTTRPQFVERVHKQGVESKCHSCPGLLCSFITEDPNGKSNDEVYKNRDGLLTGITYQNVPARIPCPRATGDFPN